MFQCLGGHLHHLIKVLFGQGYPEHLLVASRVVGVCPGEQFKLFHGSGTILLQQQHVPVDQVQLGIVWMLFKQGLEQRVGLREVLLCLLQDTEVAGKKLKFCLHVHYRAADGFL